MNDSQRIELREILKQSILKTENEILDLKELTQPIAPENAIGRISRMDAINNKSVNEAALRKSEEKLKLLFQAQKHIDDPEFGLCARCNQVIPAARLVLVPESNYCVNCA